MYIFFKFIFQEAACTFISFSSDCTKRIDVSSGEEIITKHWKWKTNLHWKLNIWQKYTPLF